MNTRRRVGVAMLWCHAVGKSLHHDVLLLLAWASLVPRPRLLNEGNGSGILFIAQFTSRMPAVFVKNYVMLRERLPRSRSLSGFFLSNPNSLALLTQLVRSSHVIKYYIFMIVGGV